MNAYKLALDILGFSGAAKALRGRCAGVGALLTLHHVRPSRNADPFSPNRILEISPSFLEAAINELADLGYEFVSLDAFHARMKQRDFSRKFIAFTIDDGYVDNFTYAYPIFKRYAVPFAIYICTGLMDRSVQLWWRELEEIVRQTQILRVELNSSADSFDTSTAGGKWNAFNTIYWQLRAMPLPRQLETMQRLRDDNAHKIEHADCEPLSWEMVGEMQASGLLTVGGHTVNHHALSKLSSEALNDEIERGCAVIRDRTGLEPKHFAYPFGDSGSAGEREFRAARDYGFATAVTTRKDVVRAEQSRQLFGVPRISLNGDYQRLRYLRTLMSGVPTAIHRRLNPREATC